MTLYIDLGFNKIWWLAIAYLSDEPKKLYIKWI